MFNLHENNLRPRTKELAKHLAVDLAREAVVESNSWRGVARWREEMARLEAMPLPAGGWMNLEATAEIMFRQVEADVRAAEAVLRARLVAMAAVGVASNTSAANAELMVSEANAVAHAAEAERWVALRREISTASRPQSIAAENVRRLVSEMDNKELVRFAQWGGLNEGALEEILTQRAKDCCILCLEDIAGDDVTIILPCCGNKPHKECFVKWTIHSGRCMYCSTMCDAERRGFRTHASFIRWLLWRDRMNLLLSSIDQTPAIYFLIHALRSEVADIVKNYAAMQLLDLTIDRVGNIDKCITCIHCMVREGVEESILSVIFGDGGGEAKESAGFLFLRLLDIGVISTTAMSDPLIFAAVNIYRGRMSILMLCFTYSDRERVRELYRHRMNNRIIKLLGIRSRRGVVAPHPKSLNVFRREIDIHTDALIYSLMVAQQQNAPNVAVPSAYNMLAAAAAAANTAMHFLYLLT